jgi:hypothetical protein
LRKYLLVRLHIAKFIHFDIKPDGSIDPFGNPYLPWKASGLKATSSLGTMKGLPRQLPARQVYASILRA